MPRSRRYRQPDLVTGLLEQAAIIPMLARASGDETLVLRKADK
jgi:hypothetical protein